MKQLIIIYGIPLEKIGIRNSEEWLKKVLNDQNKRTHIIINLGGEVSQIDYYTTKE